VGAKVGEKNFKIKTLDKMFLKNHVNDFISILEDIEHEYWQKEHFMIDLPGKWSYSLVVLDDSKNILGYIIASKKNRNVHIHKFVIEKKLRSLGIGKELLADLCNRCIDNDIKTVNLKVYKDKIRAIKFYKKCGFRYISTEKGGLLRMSAVLKNRKI